MGRQSAWLFLGGSATPELIRAAAFSLGNRPTAALASGASGVYRTFGSGANIAGHIGAQAELQNTHSQYSKIYRRAIAPQIISWQRK